MEKTTIANLNSFIDDGGYNLTRGGEGTPGRILSNDHKQKIIDTRERWSDEKKKSVRTKQKEGMEQYWKNANPTYIKARNKKVGAGRKQYLKNRSEADAAATNEKIKRTLQQAPTKRKSCFIDGVEYFSLSEASRTLGVPVDTIRYRTTSNNFPTYVEGKVYE